MLASAGVTPLLVRRASDLEYVLLPGAHIEIQRASLHLVADTYRSAIAVVHRCSGVGGPASGSPAPSVSRQHRDCATGNPGFQAVGRAS